MMSISTGRSSRCTRRRSNCLDSNGFGVCVAVDTLAAQFASVAAALDPAERREGIHGVALIDAEGAGADARRDRQTALGVLSPHSPCQAVLGIVGDGYRVVLVGVVDHR